MSPRGPAEALPLPSFVRQARCRALRPSVVLVSDRLWDDLLPAWARLGPFSMGRSIMRPVKDARSHDAHRRLTATFVAAAAHPTGWLSGFPTGRPWDFARRRSFALASAFTLAFAIAIA